MEELQAKEDHLLRQVQQLDSANKSWMRRFGKMLRPCHIITGILLLLLALLVFVSLLMTKYNRQLTYFASSFCITLDSIDKIMHSMGPQTGYTLLVRKIPNPMDIVLTYMQKVKKIIAV
jgi:LMBR1 domain-containing protein 1